MVYYDKQSGDVDIEPFSHLAWYYCVEVILWVSVPSEFRYITMYSSQSLKHLKSELQKVNILTHRLTIAYAPVYNKACMYASFVFVFHSKSLCFWLCGIWIYWSE